MLFTHVPFAGLFCTRRQRARGLALVTAALFAGACGGDNDGPYAPVDEPVAAATVQATPAIRFTPATVTLAVGGTVTFAFGTTPHNVFFDNAPAGAPANIPDVTSNQSVTRTFPTAGQYNYNCHLHPGMTGTVIVR